MKTTARLMGMMLALGLLASGEARAGEVTRLTVPLAWEHIPRKGSEIEINQRARAPGADVYFVRFASGVRAFSIEFDDGTACTTTANKQSMIHLTCGKRAATYELVQVPGKQAELEWLTYGSQPAADKQSAPPVPKAKLRI